VTGFDTSKVENMSGMFFGCEELTSLDLSKFNTSNVTNMSGMFDSCSGLTNLDVSKFNTSKVENMSDMFANCSKLTGLDLSKFDTSNVKDMEHMFSGCKGLTSLDLSKFDTSKVGNMSDMFYYCSGLTSLVLSSFYTSNVTDMSNMFSGCEGLTSLDLSKFDTGNVKNMLNMFSGCKGLKTIYATDKFVTTSVTSDDYCFDQCSKLVGGSGTTYDENNIYVTYARIDGGPDSASPGYFTLKPIGSKSKPDAVGDIVFSDGSATPYTADLTLTEEQKAAAIAVIFYVGTDCSNDSTSRTLGVGLAQNHGGLAWCLDSANAFEVNITTIQESDKDGSDNLSQIGEFLNDNNDTGTADKYPAFYFAENYSGTATNLGETYADGWYLPAKAELQKIYDILSTVNKELAACGGTTFDTSGVYWSSSQYASAGYVAYGLNFASGGWYTRTKGNSSYSVCAVRAFN
jgi:surface protein